MAKQLNVNLAFTADTGQARAQIQDLQNQLSKLASTTGSGDKLGLTKELSEATTKVAELKAILHSATTDNGKLDLGAFSQGLKNSGTDLKEYARILNSIGPEGSKAFATLARSITTAEIPMKRANGLLSEMWTTMKNTARWQITSMALHGFIGGLQSAIGYAKDLNKTLTDIRIVAPEKSMEDMANFAKLANKQAKELSSSTLDYAKGALIYYQQGLDDAQVQERTDVTTKMANVTGDSADEVSSYMTAIWNNFNKAGDESAEHFGDILAKLGAETAANTTEITTALEKYSAVADTIGLSYEAATAAATTLIDRTRETPEVAGTALKTIFARIEGLKQEGSTDEGGTTTSLNKYSQALHNIGVEIKDTNGEMRDADDIIDDIGSKWKGLAEDQQIALAETVAGVRQWNQFAALMNNFDYYKQYKDLAAHGSEGALQDQQDIYAESWEAARKRVTTSIQAIYMQLLDDKFFIKMTNVIADVVDGISKMIDGMGGLKTVLPLVSSLMLKAFGSNIAQSIKDMAYNIKLQRKGYDEILQKRKEANAALQDTLINYGNQGVTNLVSGSVFKQQANVQSTLIAKQEELNSLNKELTQEEKEQAGILLDIIANKGQNVIQTAEELEKNQELTTDLQRQMQASLAVRNQREEGKYNRVTDIQRTSNGLQLQHATFEQDITSLKKLEEQATFADRAWTRFRDDFEAGLGTGSDEEIKRVQQELKQYLEELDKAGIVSEECSIKIHELFDAFATGQFNLEDIEILDEEIQNLRIDVEQLYQDIESELNRAFAESPALLERYNAQLEQLRESFHQGAISEEELIQRSRELYNQAQATEEALSRMNGPVPTMSDGMVALANSAMQVAAGLSMITNLGSIWKNEDLTEGEKLFQTFTNLAMVLPILTSLINKNNIAQLSIAPRSLAVAMGFITEAEATKIAAEANASLGASFKALWLSMAPILPFLALAAAAIGGVIFAIKAQNKAIHSAEIAYSHAKENAEETAQVFQEVKSQINTVDDAISNLDSKTDTLNNLTKGTEEWGEAFNDVAEASVNVRNEIDKLADSSQMQDYFNSRITPVQQEIKDENGNTTDIINRTSGRLLEGIDYIRDVETGLLELTDIGRDWSEQLKQIAESQAQMVNNAAQMNEKFSAMSASTEKIRNDFSSFSADNSVGDLISAARADGGTRGYREGPLKELTTETIDQISNLLASGKLTDEDFNLAVQDFAEKAGISESLANLIQGNDKLSQALIDNGELIKTNTDAISEMATSDLLSDTKDINGAYQKIYGENSDIDKKYRAGLASYMGAEVSRQSKRGLSDEDWEQNQQYYKESYAAQKNLSYDAKKNKFTDSEGNEKAVEDADIQKLIAYNKALDDVNNNFELYRKILKDTKKDQKSLDNIKDIWKKQSSAIKEASQEIKEHGKTWDDLDKKLKKGISETAESIREDLAEALDLEGFSEEKQKDLLDGQFLIENCEDIEKALDGDVEALNRLQSAAAEKFVLDIVTSDGTFDELDQKISNLSKEISSLNQDIEIGAVLTGEDEFVQKCQNMINAAHMTSEQAQDYFSAMGYDVEFESATESPETFTQEQPRIHLGTRSIDFRVPRLSLSGMLDGPGGDAAISWQNLSFSVPDISFGGKDTSDSVTGGAKATALKIKTLKKVNGGNIGSGPTKSPGRRPSGRPSSGSSGSGGRRGSGSGGRRGSGSTTTRASRQSEKTTVVKRYKEITDQLDRNARASERLQKVQDRLYGKSRLNQMDKINKKHLEEIALLRKKAKEARQYYLDDKKDAKDALNSVKAIVKARVNNDRGGKGKNDKQIKKTQKKINSLQKKNKSLKKKGKTKSKKYKSNQKKIKNLNKKLKNLKSTNTKTGKHYYLTNNQIKALQDNIINGSLEFNDSGEISNYTEIMEALQDELNAYERYYNNAKNFKDEQSQSKYKETKIDPLKDAVSKLQEAIDQYDETRTLIQELKDQIEDAYIEWQDTNYEKLTYALELKVGINEKDLDFIEHKISQISDNLYKAAEVLDYYLSDSKTSKINLMSDAIKIQTDNLKKLDEAYQNGRISQDVYVEGLQSSYDALLANVEALQSLKTEMNDYYANTLQSVLSEFSRYNNRIDTTSSLLSYYKDILDLTGRSVDYTLLEDLQAAQAVVATTKIETAKATYEMSMNEFNKINEQYEKARKNLLNAQTPEGLINIRQQKLAEIEAKIVAGAAGEELSKLEEQSEAITSMTDDALKTLVEEEEKYYSNALTAAEEAMTSAQDAMFSNVTEALQASAEAFETSLERAAKAMEDALTGIVGGFEEISRQMGLTSTRQEEYLTKTNQTYELNKMQRTLAKDMDKTDSQAAKVKFANFSKELKALEEKDELSNLELDIAQKKYELLKAQIALEDTQNAKQTIRLSRDNEGNYGYVYVANEQAVEDATQAVEDANNNLYNTQLEAVNNYGQKQIQMVQEYQNALREFIQSDEFRNMTTEQQQERIGKIRQQYESLISSYSDLYGIGLDSTDYLQEALRNDSWLYSNYNNNIDFMLNSLPSGISNYLADTSSALDVFNTQMNNITNYVKFDDRMDKIVSKTENTMNQVAKDFEDTGELMTKVLDEVKDKIINFADETLPLINKWTTDVDSIIENIKSLLEAAANGKIERSSESFNKFMNMISKGSIGENDYTANHIAFSDKLGLSEAVANKMSDDTIAKNEQIASELIKYYEKGVKGYFGFNKNGLMSYITGATKSDAEYKKWVKNILNPIAFDTGGYTGDWSGSGKMAVLDQKELVLNERDTANILAVVDRVRGLASSGFLSQLVSTGLSNSGRTEQQIQQNVTIDAAFPSVTDRYEIEQAFNNLVNRASQYAFNTQK